MDRDITILRLVMITGAQWEQAERLLNRAQGLGFLIEVPSKTTVDIGWLQTDNQSHTATVAPTFE